MEARPRVSPAELELLEYINERHPVTVREVADHFAAADGRARTTVLTLMERLRKKGYLTRRSEHGSNRYSPCEPKGDVLRGVVRDFVQRTLGGSVQPFVAYLGSDADLSDDELDELKRLVRELDARRTEEE
jgi:predicted transcriptional regulator